MKQRLTIIHQFLGRDLSDQKEFRQTRNFLRFQVASKGLFIPAYGVVLLLFAIGPVRERLELNWQSAGLLMMFVVVFLTNALISFFQHRLLIHVQRLRQQPDAAITPDANHRLQALIEEYAQKDWLDWLLLISGLLIVIGAGWQTLTDSNPYWPYFQWPITVWYALMVGRLMVRSRRYRRHLRAVEAGLTPEN